MDTYVFPSYSDVQDTFSEAPPQAPWEEHQWLIAKASCSEHSRIAFPSHAVTLPRAPLQSPPCPSKLPAHNGLFLRCCFQVNSRITHSRED